MTSTKLKLIVFTIFSSLLLLSCKKNKQQNNVTGPKVHVLLSEILPSGAAKLSLWKAGTTTTLIEQDEASLTGIQVAENADVYISGSQFQPSFGDVAKYWKNNVPVILSTLPSVAYDIQLAGNDIYIAGAAANKAVIWKNGVANTITNGSTTSEAVSVFVHNSDVYAVVHTNVSVNNVAQIWKNGVLLYTLNDGTETAFVRSLFVYGGDVYACGFDYYSAGIRRPVFWKNGIKNYLGSNTGEGLEVIVVSNDVYIAGWESSSLTGSSGVRSIAKYWKNGIPVEIGKEYSSVCSSIKLVGSDIYCAGFEKNSSNAKTVAKYWKNGNAVIIASSATNNIETRKMVVK